MSLTYEPSMKPLRITAKQLFLNRELYPNPQANPALAKYEAPSPAPGTSNESTFPMAPTGSVVHTVTRRIIRGARRIIRGAPLE